MRQENERMGKMNRIWTFMGLLLVGLAVALAMSSGAVLAEGPGTQAALGTEFTYQGHLKLNGAAINQPCDFGFSLWDSESGTSGQIGSELFRLDTPVENGRFTAVLDFGADPFQGDERWLKITVRYPTDIDPWVTLTPRQKLTATPYALYAMNSPAHWGESWSGNSVGLVLSSNDYYGLWATSGSGYPAVVGNATGGSVVLPTGGDGLHGMGSNNGVYGWGTTAGVAGHSSSGRGVKGTSGTSVGVEGTSTSGAGVKGTSTSNYGVFAHSDNGTSLYVDGAGANGLRVDSAGESAIYVGSAGHDGIRVNSANWSGVYVYGAGSDAIRVQGAGQDGLRIFSATRNFIRLGPADNDLRLIVATSGDVYSDGEFYSSGADFAELMVASPGAITEPGDVLMIGPDGKPQPCFRPNATNLLGVHSTDPAYVGGSGDNFDIEGKIPVGITGIAPVKVSAENGPIEPGDLLTSSSLQGHAMKASAVTIEDVSFYRPGTILGKALEPLDEGTGVISALIALQ
jgi:hypothetical protein